MTLIPWKKKAIESEQPAAEEPAAEAKAAKEPTLEEQIRDLEGQIEALEKKREKTAVDEIVFEPNALAACASARAKERFPRVKKEVEKHLKQLAWSGEKVAYLEPKSAMFNDQLLKWLKEEGFGAKLISLGANNGYKIEVTFGVGK